MAGRLLTSLTLALSFLGVSGLPQSSKREGFYLGVPISNPDAQNTIPHRYIVVYNDTFSDDDVAAHEETVIKTIAKRNIGKRSPLTGQLLSTMVNTYKVGPWRAMTLEADDLLINEIYSANEVEYIEQDAYISINRRAIQRQATSGLVRISHAQPTRNATYIFDDSAGEGITAFVVDTGIRVTHREFEGRATWGANFIDNDVCSVVSRRCQAALCDEDGICSHLNRTRMAMATEPTLLARLVARPSVSPRRSSSSPSRSWTPKAAAPTRASLPACSSVSTK